MISYMLEDCRIPGVEYNLTGEPCAVNAACPVRRGGNGTPFCMGSRVLPYYLQEFLQGFMYLVAILDWFI